MDPREETYLDMARIFEEELDFARARKWYQKIEGSGEVYEILGEYYYLGRGCRRDVQKARLYFEKAAFLGETDALCNQALCEEDPGKKLELYKRAAMRGLAYAMNMVGIVLEEYGLEDAYPAVKWFYDAANEGLPEGCYNYAMNTKAAGDVKLYLQKAAEKNFIPAMEKYALFLQEGWLCKRNPEEAEKLWAKIRLLKGGE